MTLRPPLAEEGTEHWPYPLRSRPSDPRLRRPSRFRWNLLSAFFRKTPDFLILGEMKCGTSSLFDYLNRHERISPPFRKEVHYFDLAPESSWTWYKAHFPVAPGRKETITGEATPAYLFAPGALERIALRLPRAKMIVLLRDPVDRAISHYHHEVRAGREYLDLKRALACEEARIEAAGTDSGNETLLHASYKGRGHYARSLRRLFDLYPRDRTLVLSSRSLFADPRGTTNQVLEFLGLSPLPANETFPVKNEGSYEPPEEEARQILRNHFEPLNEELRELLGSDFRF